MFRVAVHFAVGIKMLTRDAVLEVSRDDVTYTDLAS